MNNNAAAPSLFVLPVLAALGLALLRGSHAFVVVTVRATAGSRSSSALSSSLSLLSSGHPAGRQRVALVGRTFVGRSGRGSSTVLRSSSTSGGNNDNDYEYALLFDCDGVLLETEELHRRAYNAAFDEFQLTIVDDDGEDGSSTGTKKQKPVEWTVEYYDVLQNTVGGGKPKMFHYFRETVKQFPSVKGEPAPATEEEQKALVDALQDWKTSHYKTLLETEAETRPGVLELMDEALADPDIAVGVCSASTKAAALKTLDITLGPDRVSKLDVCILGDDVPAKKPDPLIYNVAAQRLNMPADRCVVIEDSLIGLQAAKGANMKCVVTYTSSTADQDFYSEGADAVVPDLASRKVTLQSIFDPIRQSSGTGDATILDGIRDPPPPTTTPQAAAK